MPQPRQARSRVQERRSRQGWTQAELAERAGISRAAVSAIEIERLVPSVAAALALARVLGTSVEDLFGRNDDEGATPWAWAPAQEQARFWKASVGTKTFLYPVETTASGALEHDGIVQDGVAQARNDVDADRTILIACCDPAAALLAVQIRRLTGLRVIVLPRSSRQALSLLGQGLVHAAGVHLSTCAAADANAAAARECVGSPFELLRIARWQEGLALAPGIGVRSIQNALRAGLRWVGREAGSGARQCLDQLLGRRPAPKKVARDHRGVVEAIRCGWADAGVCLRLVSEEAGLRFFSVQEEIYELCLPAGTEGDPRLSAIKNAVRSLEYRRLLADLPGYDSAECGHISEAVDQRG
jgi:molybdate-binding protein/DNA-binding XRE family transcriptional regulator